MTAGGAHHPTAVVLSAHVSGYDVVRGRLADVVTLVHPSGTRVECGRLTGTAWRVALCETGTGALTAAALTTQLFDWLRPQALLLVGVARPLKDSLPPGSVVVATKVYGVQGGRAAPEGFLARPEVWRCSHRLEQTARHALRGGAHFAPVAVSDVVLADPESAPARSLRQHYEDAVAIETDSTGVLHAAHLGGRPDTLVVHGIGGADECRDGPGGREDPDLTAAQAAAEAVVEVLRRMEPATRAARSGHLRGRLLLAAGLLGLSVTAFALWQQWSGRSDAVASPGAAGASPSPAARPSPSPTGTAPSRRPTPSPSPDDGHGPQRPTPSLPPENLLPPPGLSASVTVGPTTVEVTPAPSAPAPPTPTASQFEALISWTDDGSCEGDCPVKAYRTPQEDDTQFTGTLYRANQKFLVACQKDNGRRMKVGARYSGPGFQNGVWFYVAERREWVSGARVSVTPFPLPAVCP